MLQRILLVTLVALLGHTISVSAQSAAYFCKQTGAYGFCYGSKSVMAARECAYNDCIERGGTQPVVIVFTDRKGYGAICIGTDALDNTVMGVSMGYDTQDEADKEARMECEKQGAVRMRVSERWHDE